MVTGPPGAGKTTALAGWARSRPEGSTAWLSLEKADNQPARFWSRLEAAVGSSEPPGRDLATAPALIVDDFQVISNRRLLDQFGSLLLGGRSFARPIVVASRSAPDLPLHRLRLSGELTEIGDEVLRFRVDETRALLEMVFGPGSSGAAFAGQRARALTECTEGWAAGLRLAAAAVTLGPDGESEAGSSEVLDAVAGYFAREVLDHLTPGEERFLLDTSVLARLSGGLGQALTGRGDAHLILTSLAERNLFLIRLDEQGRWFRYHRLFGEFLRHRLLLGDPSRARRAALRAAAWHRRQGDEPTALSYLVEAPAYRGAPVLASSGPGFGRLGDRGADLGPSQGPAGGRAGDDPEKLYRLASARLHAGLLAEGDRWLRRLEGAVTGRVGLAWQGPIEGLRAVQASLRGDAAGVLQHCAEARRLVTPPGPARPALGGGRGRALGPCHPFDPSLPGRLDTLAARAHLWLDRPDKAEAILAHRFSAGLDDGHDPAATGVRALVACRRGQLQDAWMLASRALELAGERQPAPMPAILDALLASTLVLWERHDLDAAALPSVPTLADGQEPLTFWPLECQLIQVMISGGRPGEAMSRLARLRARLGDAGCRQPVAARLDVLGIRCAEMLGGRHPALQALIDSPPGRYPTEELAWADLRAGRPDRAAARLSSPGDQATSVGAELRRLTLAARARIRMGDERHALATLRHALELGRPGGYVTAFVDDAPELIRLLRKMAGPFPDGYVAGVVDHAEQAHAGAGAARPAAAVEPLSEREREILTHLPSHRSQGQIAAEMYVSINTVKTHVRAVYRKLGVSSRSAAVAVARAQKLI